MIQATPEDLNSLRLLSEEKKFVEETYYPGAPTEEIRQACERRVNVFLADIVELLQGRTKPDRLGQFQGIEVEKIFAEARKLSRTFDLEDTEEREKVDDYIGEAMRILKIEDWMDQV